MTKETDSGVYEYIVAYGESNEALPKRSKYYLPRN